MGIVRQLPAWVKGSRCTSQPHLKRVFEAFGRERCYWGTDLTSSFAKATYRQERQVPGKSDSWQRLH